MPKQYNEAATKALLKEAADKIDEQRLKIESLERDLRDTQKALAEAQKSSTLVSFDPLPRHTVQVKKAELKKLLDGAEREEEYAGRMEPVCIVCGNTSKKTLGLLKDRAKHKPNCVVVKLMKQIGMEPSHGYDER